MNCMEFREIISAELDLQATDEQLILAYNHLANCRDCRQWRHNILEIKGIFASIEPAFVPPSIEKQLRRSEKLTLSGKSDDSSKRFYFLPRRLVWAAAAIILLQFGWTSYQIIDRSSKVESEFDYGEATTIVLTANDRTSSSMTIGMPEVIRDPDNPQKSKEE